MWGIRFINQLSLRFNLKVIKSFEVQSHIFNKNRPCKTSAYIFDNFYTVCFSKHHVAFSKDARQYMNQYVYKFPIQEKHKILQLISEALSK